MIAKSDRWAYPESSPKSARIRRYPPICRLWLMATMKSSCRSGHRHGRTRTTSTCAENIRSNRRMHGDHTAGPWNVPSPGGRSSCAPCAPAGQTRSGHATATPCGSGCWGRYCCGEPWCRLERTTFRQLPARAAGRMARGSPVPAEASTTCKSTTTMIAVGTAQTGSTNGLLRSSEQSTGSNSQAASDRDSDRFSRVGMTACHLLCFCGVLHITFAYIFYSHVGTAIPCVSPTLFERNFLYQFHVPNTATLCSFLHFERKSPCRAVPVILRGQVTTPAPSLCTQFCLSRTDRAIPDRRPVDARHCQ